MGKGIFLLDVFDNMDIVFSGKHLEAKKHDINDWVFIFWKKNTLGFLPKTLIRELRQLEDYIRTKKFQGWYCNSEPEHEKMHTVIKKCGAEPFEEPGSPLLWFKKEMMEEKIYV